MDITGMIEYTRWWIAHPWHVTKGMTVPFNCDCGCQKPGGEYYKKGTGDAEDTAVR